MNWFLRAAGWATALAFPCLAVSHAYQATLGDVVRGAMLLTGRRIPVIDVDFNLPCDLGLYVALCLASTRAGGRDRMRALIVGLPALVALQVLMLAVMGAVMLESRRTIVPIATLQSVLYLGDVVPWMSALMMWIALVGPREAPFMTPRSTGAPARAGGSSGGATRIRRS